MEIFGYIAGLLTLIAYLPQTIKTIQTRHTKDLSLSTFVIVGISALLWTIYGISQVIPAIWVTNGVVTVCSSIIVLIKLQNDSVK